MFALQNKLGTEFTRYAKLLDYENKVSDKPNLPVMKSTTTKTVTTTEKKVLERSKTSSLLGEIAWLLDPGLCIKSYLISQTMQRLLVSSSSCPRDVLTPALSKEKGICDLNQVLLLLTSLQLE